MTLSSIFARSSYLQVLAGEKTLRGDNVIFYRRTTSCDLRTSEGRKDAIILLVDLFVYLRSGNAKIRRLQLALAPPEADEALKEMDDKMEEEALKVGSDEDSGIIYEYVEDSDA